MASVHETARRALTAGRVVEEGLGGGAFLDANRCHLLDRGGEGDLAVSGALASIY
eukprot:GDKH01006153.1.p2 GENE.GDKH01006153.1~~GDKH01006153.1.p2  ORF type:complete len:55 (-),score=9.75 GDKH01006153.1:49-213(-)